MAEFVDENLIDSLFEANPDRRCRQAMAKARLKAARMRQQVPPRTLLETDDDDGYGQILLDRLAAEPGPPGPSGRAALAAGVRRMEVADLMGDPITPRLLSELHAEVSEIRNPRRRGAWRLMPVATVNEEAIYAPPSAIERLVDRACTDFETVSTDGLTSACAMATAIEAIHPFGDANSRVARLILALALARAGMPPIAFDTRGLIRSYMAFTSRWIRDDECEPMLTLVANECSQEAENRLVYALL